MPHGPNLAVLPISKLRPSILDQGHAHKVLDSMCQPSCILHPHRTRRVRRNARTATASHAAVNRQRQGRRLKGAGCRSRQGRRHPRPVSLSPGTSTSRPSRRLEAVPRASARGGRGTRRQAKLQPRP